VKVNRISFVSKPEQAPAKKQSSLGDFQWYLDIKSDLPPSKWAVGKESRCVTARERKVNFGSYSKSDLFQQLRKPGKLKEIC
jgi:hypothetical protein